MINQIDLILAYYKFIRGKRKKKDIQEFMLDVEYELVELFKNIFRKNYHHGKYEHFKIFDPKQREIDKAAVKDRVVHQLIYDYLVKIYDKKFYFHSYAARKGKGTHRAINILYKMIVSDSLSFRRNIFIAKCDIEKFFANIDKEILLELIQREIIDQDYLYLIEETIDSFKYNFPGIPLGNLTSQVFANIYLNELDRFIKHDLKLRHYIRYMDDFIIIEKNTSELLKTIFKIENFLKHKLHIGLHVDKIIIRKLSWGVDFLGYVQLPQWRILRTATKKRIFKKIKLKIKKLKNSEIDKNSFNQAIQSYFGVLKHCSSFKLKQEILNLIKSELN